MLEIGINTGRYSPNRLEIGQTSDFSPNCFLNYISDFAIDF